MIVIGVDAHKRTQTLVALEAGTGELLGQRTVLASDAGALEAVRFGQGLDQARVWAIEDCRHVSGRFERALIAAGERVIRIPPALTSTARRTARTPGKCDPIDATAVARGRSAKVLRASRPPSWTSGRWTSVCCATTATS